MDSLIDFIMFLYELLRAMIQNLPVLALPAAIAAIAFVMGLANVRMQLPRWDGHKK